MLKASSGLSFDVEKYGCQEWLNKEKVACDGTYVCNNQSPSFLTSVLKSNLRRLLWSQVEGWLNVKVGLKDILLDKTPLETSLY